MNFTSDFGNVKFENKTQSALNKQTNIHVQLKDSFEKVPEEDNIREAHNMIYKILISNILRRNT